MSAESHERHRFEKAVKSQAGRRLRAAKGEGRGVLYWVGMFGLVGWSVALPTVLGIALGIYLDDRWPSQVSWTLTLLLGGLLAGCLTAWRWLRAGGGEFQPDHSKEKNDS